MILIADSQLTKEECNELIDEVRPSLVSAQTLGKNIDGYRTADNGWIRKNTPLTDKVKQLVFKYTGVPIENQEAIHIVRYGVGGEYKPHHDYFHKGEDYYDSVMAMGGQRTHTALFYLNDGFTGGETEFPKRNIKITPKIGRLLLWRNMVDGVTYDESFHAGLPVIEGEKWIAVVWIREQAFNLAATPAEPVTINVDLGTLLDKRECEKLSLLVVSNKENGTLSLETDTRYYNNSYGGTPPFLWELMERFQPLVEAQVGKKVKKANPYVRIYNNASILNPHTDREGLDYTLSICLFENLDTDWNLNVKNADGTVTSHPSKIGRGALVSGRILEHWREQLVCDDGKYVIQLFLHYEQI